MRNILLPLLLPLCLSFMISPIAPRYLPLFARKKKSLSVDDLLEIRDSQGPTTREELLDLILDKFEDAENEIQQSREELMDMIEEERAKADEEREEATMKAAMDLDDKIEGMIGTFMDKVKPSREEADAVIGETRGAAVTEVQAIERVKSFRIISLGAEVPKDWVGVPSLNSLSAAFPAGTCSDAPTTLLLLCPKSTLTLGAIDSFVSSNPTLKFDDLDHLILVTPIGTQRTGQFPFSLLNTFGGLDKVAAAETEVITYFQRLIDDRRNKQAFDIQPVQPGLTVTNLKIGDQSNDSLTLSIQKPSKDAVEGVPLFGSSPLSVGVGDVFNGGLLPRHAAPLLTELMIQKANATLTAVSLSDEDATDEQIKSLASKAFGPEIARFTAFETKPAGLYEFLANLLEATAANKGSGDVRLTTDVVAVREDGDMIVRVLFLPDGSGFADKDKKKDEWEKEEGGGSGSGRASGRAGEDGGVEVRVRRGGGVTLVTVGRCNYPMRGDKKVVPIKEMSEGNVVRIVRRGVEEWVANTES